MREIYNKFGTAVPVVEKSRKIKKDAKGDVECKRSKRLKDKNLKKKKAVENYMKWQEGKENKIMQ